MRWSKCFIYWIIVNLFVATTTYKSKQAKINPLQSRWYEWYVVVIFVESVFYKCLNAFHCNQTINQKLFMKIVASSVSVSYVSNVHLHPFILTIHVKSCKQKIAYSIYSSSVSFRINRILLIHDTVLNCNGLMSKKKNSKTNRIHFSVSKRKMCKCDVRVIHVVLVYVLSPSPSP